ncbi:mrp21p [Saccharomyces arboricola H-6]|uniref:Mrp21p n=1 Tax=Saccharomyces arboricola (strain H-6 / AS 2.3317 / CBS 10644) TaxID=1160507 RepID=J8QAL9_SACAR|nr:mrp21p [Saccharomyces arboricola H-6]
MLKSTFRISRAPLRRAFTTTSFLRQQNSDLDKIILNPIKLAQEDKNNNGHSSKHKGDNAGILSMEIPIDMMQSAGRINRRELLSEAEIARGSVENAQMRFNSGKSIIMNKNNPAESFKRLNRIMFENNIPGDKRSQRFYMKPGKVAELKRSQRHRKEFMMGFKRLIEIVKDAKRKGY